MVGRNYVPLHLQSSMITSCGEISGPVIAIEIEVENNKGSDDNGGLIPSGGRQVSEHIRYMVIIQPWEQQPHHIIFGCEASPESLDMVHGSRLTTKESFRLII
jgi:hypothetical protein